MQASYQSWFYRVGLVGLVAIAAIAIVASAANDSRDSELRTESPTTAAGAQLSTPPGVDAPFSLSSPLNNSHWTVPVVTFVGVGPPGATVSVAGGPGVVITDAGTFAVPALLNVGQNDVSVVVTTDSGAQSSLTVTVFYEVPVPRTDFSPTTHPPVGNQDGTHDTKPPKEDTTTTTGGGGGSSTTTTSQETTTTTTDPPTTTTTEPVTTTTEEG